MRVVRDDKNEAGASPKYNTEFRAAASTLRSSDRSLFSDTRSGPGAETLILPITRTSSGMVMGLMSSDRVGSAGPAVVRPSLPPRRHLSRTWPVHRCCGDLRRCHSRKRLEQSCTLDSSYCSTGPVGIDKPLDALLSWIAPLPGQALVCKK